MALQFILGNSGSGKSHLLYEKMILESRLHPECNYMVIVPEQFTMQTQKDLVMRHPDGGIMNIDVLSFRRLAHRIFEEVGADKRIVLTETGKNLMIRKVAIEQKQKLKVLGAKMNLPGYVSEVKSILSELMQYEITDFELNEMMEYVKNRPLLHAKLADVRELYQAFLNYQRERFMKPEELLDVLCQVTERSSLLTKSTIALDGFTGFTPSQMNVIRELLKLCPNVLVTVTIDAREAFFSEIQEHELFALSKKMIKSLSELAQKTGTELEEPVILGTQELPRFEKGGDLYHLEQNLFRRKRQIYQGEMKEISLHVSQNPAAEVHFAARTINRLVQEEGYRYRDIAVITGNLSSYDNYVKKIFPMYGVSAFIDETRHILLNPCLEFIRGALMAVEKDFSAEAVFRYLRTGMAGLSSDEIDRMENYVLAAGIRGRKKWETPWQYCPKDMTPEEVQSCDASRISVMEKLSGFADRMHGNGVVLREYVRALYDLLVQCQVQQQLKDREIALLNAGAKEEAKEYDQIFAILIQLFDEMAELLGEEVVSSREFAEILDAGFAEAKVGIIPPGIDQVQVGDIERSRLANIKVLFFLGLNDGWVPARGENSGIVSDMERELLQETGIALAPSARENSYIQRFYLYQNLTKPQKRLYLSWCSTSGDGTVMRPSYLAATLLRMFPQLKVQEEQEIGTSIHQVTSKQNGMLYLTQGLQRIRNGQEDPAWMELYQQYIQDEAYQERVQELVKAAFTNGRQGKLSFTTTKELYGEIMKNSVTRLEQFASCAFAHFAQYGLHLSERELYGIKPADIGILFHRAMELFSRQLQKEQRDWAQITYEEQKAVMEHCVDQVSEEYGLSALKDSARDAYTIRRLKRILGRSVWALHEQLKAGTFRPAAFEVSFEDAGNLEAVHVKFGEHGKLRLQGRIDRIDTAETEDTVYIKIMDYKSGMAQFDPVSLYYGLQLQLVVYLNAALELEQKLNPEKKVLPAGIFYYRMQDPVLELEEGADEEKMRKKLLKKLRPDGLVNEEDQVLRLFDQNLHGDSLVIPVGLKKDGSLKAASSTASALQFRQLSGFVTKKMTQMAEQIMEGEVGAAPFVDEKSSACEFCAYADVCGFDRKLSGMKEKRALEQDKCRIWELIARESGITGKEQE